MAEDFKKSLILMTEVMAEIFANFNNFMAVGANKFIAISLAIFYGCNKN